MRFRISTQCYTIIWLLEYFFWCKKKLVASAIGTQTDEKGELVFSTLTHHNKFSISTFSIQLLFQRVAVQRKEKEKLQSSTCRWLIYRDVEIQLDPFTIIQEKGEVPQIQGDSEAERNRRRRRGPVRRSVNRWTSILLYR